MTQQNTSHGVLYAAALPDHLTLLTIKNGKWIEQDISVQFHRTLIGLCTIAEGCQFTHLWVMPDVCHPDRAFYQEAVTEYDLFASWQINDPEIANAFELEDGEENLLVSVTGCRRPKGGKHFFTICFPGNCQWSWCDEGIAPKSLLQTVKLLEDALGVPVGSGPTTVGMRLVEAIVGEPGKNKTKLKKPDVDLAAIPFNQAARTIIWQRPLAGDERTRNYLHKVDKHSDFLRACVGCQVGVGTPVKVFTDQGVDEGLPGIWHIVKLSPEHASLRFPPHLWRDAQWASTPIVKMLRRIGYTVTIVEGYQFPNHAPLLGHWALALWETRQQFKAQSQDTLLFSVARRECYARAYDGIKDIAATTMGVFATQIADIQRTWKYRPDWWAQVVGTARALMFYNMLKVDQECGLTPVLVYVDSLLYVSDEPDVAQALPGLALRPALGCYKHEWTLPMSHQVLAILDSEEGEAWKMGQLNDLAEGNADEPVD